MLLEKGILVWNEIKKGVYGFYRFNYNFVYCGLRVDFLI